MDENNEKLKQQVLKLTKLSKELEDKITLLEQENEELTIFNNQLLEEREQEDRLHFAWTGNLGHWYWNVKTNKVAFNPLKITTLGYKKNEIPNKVNYQFFTDKIHPDDYSNTMNVMMEHLQGKRPVYEVEYRIRTKDGNYKWYLDRGKITMRDAEGKPLFLAGIVFDITDKKMIEKELEYKNKILSSLSYTDGLTNLYNHRFLMEKLEEKREQWLKEKKQFSIAMFDIDNFKQVNDTFGHIYGDKVLQEIARLMKENVRETDFVGRYGGEEFLIVFPDSDYKLATKVAERIREAIERYDFEKGKITISGGIKEYDGTSLKEFIQKADINLYQSKRNGKNQICSD